MIVNILDNQLIGTNIQLTYSPHKFLIIWYFLSPFAVFSVWAASCSFELSNWSNWTFCNNQQGRVRKLEQRFNTHKDKLGDHFGLPNYSVARSISSPLQEACFVTDSLLPILTQSTWYLCDPLRQIVQGFQQTPILIQMDMELIRPGTPHFDEGSWILWMS